MSVAYVNSRQSYCVYSDTEKDNILVDDQKDAVLSDFGLTRINDTIFKSINSTVQSGNPRWTAPELLLSSISDDLKASYAEPHILWGVPTPRCDIWSFGMTCLEIMTGKRPFSHLALDGGPIWEIYKGKRPARPDCLVGADSWHDKLWSLIQACWDAKPKNRPSATAVLAALAEILGSELSKYPGIDLEVSKM